MKKIAVLVKNLTSGGAEKQAILLAKTLSSEYKVHFIIFNGAVYDESLHSHLKKNNAIHIEYLQGKFFIKLLNLRKYLRRMDISHLFSYLTGANLYGILATWKFSDINVYSGIRNAQLPFIKLIIDKILANYFAAKVVLNSYAAKSYCINNGFKANKLVVIPNCFENIKQKTERQDRGIFKIITIARFVPQKDYYTSLAAVANVIKIRQDLVYQIVGYGQEEAKIRQWIKDLELEQFVELHIKPNYIERLLIEADIYITTSLFEGTSNSVMEAMNASLPIIATNVGDNNQLVENEINGYIVDTKDVKDIATKITDMLSDLSLRNTMGIKSNEMLRNSYSMESFKDQYITLIEASI